MNLPVGYRHDFCSFCGKLIGHPSDTLPICSECEERESEPPAPSVFWVWIVSFVLFLGGVVALAGKDRPLGALTVIAGLVAAGSWAIYQKWEKSRKYPPQETNPFTALGCTRCVDRALRRHKAMDEALETVTAYPEEAEPHYELGELYEEEGELEMALTQYRLADELANEGEAEPDFPEFRADCERVTQLLARQKQG